MSDAPVQLPPTLPLTVTLTLQQWRAVLDALGNGPFRVVSPLIGEIDRQCGAQLERVAPAYRGNGAQESRPDA